MGLLDFLKFAKPTPVERQALTTVTRILSWTETTDLNWNLNQGNRRDLRKLYMDDEICAATDTRKEACTSTPWRIVGGDETVNKEIWELFQPIIPTVLGYSWWAVPYGFSVIQLIWKFEGNKFIPDFVLDQPFESFKLDKDQKLVFASDQSQVAMENKFFATIRNPSAQSPLGEALYQRLYTAYFYRLNAWEFWISYLESWGKPFIHAASDDNDQKTVDFLKTLIGVKRPRGVITGKNTELKVVEGSGSGAMSFKDFEQALSQRIQRLILGQTLTSGAGDIGSQALGTVHNEVRDDKRQADCKLLETTIQKIINSYFVINDLKGEIPMFEFQQIKGLNKDLAERDNLLQQQGVQHTEKYYEENYDFDPEDFELVEPQLPVGQPFQAGTKKNQRKPGRKFAADQEVIDAQIKTEENALENSANVFTQEEIFAAVKKAKNKKDLINNLAQLMGKDSKKFEDDVTKALLMANVEGFDHGTQGD